MQGFFLKIRGFNPNFDFFFSPKYEKRVRSFWINSLRVAFYNNRPSLIVIVSKLAEIGRKLA
jgi:hypothetical protein